MYLVFTCWLSGSNSIGKMPDLEEPWMTGAPRLIDYSLPLKYEIDQESTGNIMSDYYIVAYPLMSDRLVAALEEAGIDNLQKFDAEIYNPLDDKTYTNYKAVNIIGAISCVDKEKSDIQIDNGDFASSFNGFSVDESKAAGNIFFRLKENVAVVLADEKVADIVEEKDIPGISFIYPENWAV